MKTRGAMAFSWNCLDIEDEVFTGVKVALESAAADRPVDRVGYMSSTSV